MSQALDCEVSLLCVEESQKATFNRKLAQRSTELKARLLGLFL